MTQTDNQLKTPSQEQVLGQLLVDVLRGEIQESTRKLVCALEYKRVPAPFNHFVSWIQGSSESNHDLTISVLGDVLYAGKKVLEKIK